MARTGFPQAQPRSRNPVHRTLCSCRWSDGRRGLEFAGWLYRDLQDTATATYWYDRAMEWAQGAHDTGLQGYVLLKKAQTAYDERDAHQMATLAEAANHSLWQLPIHIRAEVAQQEARGLAMLGEPFIAVEQKIDEADRLFAITVDRDDRPQFGTYLTGSAFIIRRAICYMEAGKPGKAAELFDTVLGDNERTTREVHRTVKALAPWSSRPGPRQLREALRTAVH